MANPSVITKEEQRTLKMKYHQVIKDECCTNLNKLTPKEAYYVAGLVHKCLITSCKQLYRDRIKENYKEEVEEISKPRNSKMDKDDVREKLEAIVDTCTGTEMLKAAEMLAKMGKWYNDDKVAGVIFEQVQYGKICESCKYEFTKSAGV